MIKNIILQALVLFAAAMPATVGAASPAAPSDANINGHVIDKSNGEHIPFCAVKLLGTSVATLTDASGHYHLRDLKPGKYTVEVSYVGYKTETKAVDIARDQTLSEF